MDTHPKWIIVLCNWVFSKNLCVFIWWLNRWLIFGVTSYQYIITITCASATIKRIATTIMSILIAGFLSHDNASLIVFPQLLSTTSGVHPANPPWKTITRMSSFCWDTISNGTFLCGRYTLSRMLHVGSPASNPGWFQGLIDAGSRCNQFFLSHQCCFQGAATWLKVNELRHWKFTKLPPNPPWNQQQVSSSLKVGLFCCAIPGSRIVSRPLFQGQTGSVRVLL